MTDSAFWKQLDAQNDESAVRISIVSNHYTPDTVGVAQEWVRRKEEARASISAAQRDAREIKTLRIAILAIIIAAISSINEIKWLMNSIISWLP